MKKSLVGIAALAAMFIVTPALAADLSRPVYTKAPPPPPPVFSWTGCYVGGNIGGVWAHKDWTNATPGGVIGQPIGSHDADSWLGRL
jgi:outer membrane immunogenic protein